MRWISFVLTTLTSGTVASIPDDVQPGRGPEHPGRQCRDRPRAWTLARTRGASSPTVTLMSGSVGDAGGDDRPVALVTTACRGPGLDVLRDCCDVVLDPWIDQRPLRICDGDALAARVDELGATVLAC